ncbi:hypothetical protein P0082_00755 [Candidatus Haliotispira prima]|uniref:Uncharacterized protein n=1 Tax=Candidatus Haliotispira prima TaxID=3034016 RepID=A0ABY8MJ67_9SPIO|nr:hypothetical protein P0082_00755 [Candidatus Haliotispira prima]
MSSDTAKYSMLRSHTEQSPQHTDNREDNKMSSANTTEPKRSNKRNRRRRSHNGNQTGQAGSPAKNTSSETKEYPAKERNASGRAKPERQAKQVKGQNPGRSGGKRVPRAKGVLRNRETLGDKEALGGKGTPKINGTYAEGGQRRRGRNAGQSLPNRDRQRDGKRGRNQDQTYDLFGARIRKPGALQRRSYRPEYNQIDLPSQPQDLRCGICNETISANVDILEALEIQLGEFPSQGQSQGEESPNSSDFGAGDRALTDSVVSAHFQCVLQTLTERTQLEKEEAIAYLGAGKFAVVYGPQRAIKRIIERSEWNRNSGLSPTNWPNWRQDSGSRALVSALSIKTDI